MESSLQRRVTEGALRQVAQGGLNLAEGSKPEKAYRSVRWLMVVWVQILWGWIMALTRRHSADKGGPMNRAECLDVDGQSCEPVQNRTEVYPIDGHNSPDDDGRTRPKHQTEAGSHPNLGSMHCPSGMLRAVTRRQGRRGKGNEKSCGNQGFTVPDSTTDLRRKQLNDPDLGPVLRWVESGKRPFGSVVCSASPTTRHYWNFWDS